ncbi:MAG: iron chelate uptake ABC transporter family permease subunit [Flammeovirgaceae bacterium]
MSALDWKTSSRWVGLLFLLLLFFLLDVFLGSVSIPPNEAFKALIDWEGSNPIWANILYKIRIPKAVTAVLVGVALAISGLQMQTLFRNPLAGPSVLGITAGASLGVAFLVLSGSSATAIFTINQLGIGGSWAVVLASTLGAGLVLLVIVGVSFRVRDNVVLLIIGLMVGNITIAVVGIWQYFSSPELIKDFLMWTFGSLGGVTHGHLAVLMTVVLVGSLATFLITKPLNMLLLGEQYAKSMGLNSKKARMGIIAITSLLAGTVTGFCGPIGFIGIAVPHLTRALFRTADHKVLLPSTALLGGITLLACDIIAQLPTMATVLPINSVTALLGSPVVIWVIIRRRNLHVGRVSEQQVLPQAESGQINEQVHAKQVLKAEDLTIGYSSRALAHDLDLSVESGQVVTLVGPNGAGKSTLMRSLAGLQPILKGWVAYDEQMVQALGAKALARKLSLVLTDRDFFGDLNVYSLVAMGRYPHSGWFGNMNADDEVKIQWALKAVGMTNFAHRSIHLLSDGEKQKVLIARALAQDTPFIFLDEPTAHLDLPNRMEIFQLMKRLATEYNKAILLTTHELDWAIKMADQIWVLGKSGAFYQGDPTTLLDQQVFQQVFGLPDTWITELENNQHRYF